ncbi:retrotransposon protein [Cucumis melo var. makuwa]|uniref:Retrotransposon protein n=1 Tax=Cucumis melo var. makuwa TaxID=1194695 RepID=A0A5A7VIN1_CUCMM|nr:retrotransposon protein [Cucumis melo var. makuwa]
MNRRTFVILCHLLRTIAGLSSREIVDVEEMSVMFLHVLANYVKNRNCLVALERTYIKVNVPVTDFPTFRKRKRKISTNVLDVCDTKGNFVYILVDWEGSTVDSRILRDAHARQNRLCQRDITIFAMWVIQTLRDFSPHTEARGSVGNNLWEVVLSPSSTVSHHPSILPVAQFDKQRNKNCEDIDDVDEGDSAYATTTTTDDIRYIEIPNQWSQ